MIWELFNGIKQKARTNQKAVVFIACFLLSVIFWFITSMGRTYETIISIPVHYTNLPFTKNIEDDLPNEIDFYYQGTGFELFTTYIRSKPDSINIDIGASLTKSGRINFPTISLRNQIPGDLKPFKILPEFIAPGISTRLGKRVPVEFPESGLKFRDRFGLSGKVILRPDSIDIAGPQHELDKIHFVKTEVAEVSDIHADYFGGVNISTKSAKGIQFSQPYIHYYIPVEEYTEGMVELPVELPISQRGKVTIIPERVKVYFMVELSKYHQIHANNFKAEVEVPSNNLPPSLEIKLNRKPRGIHSVRLDPPFVDYLIHE